tara:strand:+ start:266 stop:1300 length:1035 start_codon:yes stop_codon:yes gene_type:complete
MRYLLIDSANMFFRARHVASKGTDTWGKLGLAIQITMLSVNKGWRDHNADHVIFCLDGRRGWRRDEYAPYKLNRKVDRSLQTDEEIEEHEMFMETYEQFNEFLRNDTNCTVLENEVAEADDLIARWIQTHPDDDHTIVSSDTDFIQMISSNVDLFDGVRGLTYTPDGVTNENGKRVEFTVDSYGKVKIGDKNPDFVPEKDWIERALFLKIMRGDKSDNVFSAFPGVRVKGSVKKPGLNEAFADRIQQGYNWNNIMHSKWMDHNDEEHRVLDDYKRNKSLIDLTEQPAHIKEEIDKSLVITDKRISMVGVKFLQFCGKYQLNRLSEDADIITKWLSAPSPEMVIC